MARYTSDSKDRVREAVDFVELVSARTELRRAGPNAYEGLCPFHDERTPSFGIEPVQKVYHCFGCRASGDLFTFVQETEGLDFKEALELLADRYNVELEREAEEPGEAEKRRARARMLELLARTADFYERYLWESEEAAARPRVPALAGPRRGDPARLPGRLLAQRVGPTAARIQAQRLQRRGALRHRPGPALTADRPALRPLQGRASCFR